jgi:glycosyltransferase involved in cell wall biosynthesis
VRVAHLLIGGEIAGGQLVALQLAHALRERGDDAIFVTPARGTFADRTEAEGFHVVRGDVGRLHRLRGMLALSQLLHDEQVDLLHTHTLAAANALGRGAARWARIPVVSHLHIENHFRPTTRWLLSAADNLTARLAAALVAVSADTKRAYEQQGYPRRIEVVYNGVALADGAPPGLRAELGIPAGVPLVGEVGRLCDVKGQRELIAALAQVPDARAVLVGADVEQGGAFQTALEHEAERLGVGDRVVFAGRRANAADLVGELDVLALPSWTEGLPLVVLEAMARRRPVVATPVGGTPEVVVDGETGLLVPPRDPDALAAALRRLLADADLRRRMGDAGYERVRERFSADAMTGRVLEIYDEVLR